jgi:hypothetical protein
MKTTTTLKTSIAFALLLILNACNKDNAHLSSPKPPITKDFQASEIEYRISPVPGYLAPIVYSDSTGNRVTIYNPAEFINGSKRITVRKPFDAFFSTKIFNVSGITVNFNMTISVDGEIKENLNCSVASVWPNPGAVNTVEYLVQ